MDEAEFDKFAHEYNAVHAAHIRISGEEPAYFSEYKIRDLVQVYGRTQGTGNPSILDFGAGLGSSVPFMRRHMPKAKITCLDVSSKSLELGRSRLGSDAEFVLFDGERIPFPDDTFNIVFAACVFHHIAHNEHVALLGEFRRVLAPGGLAFIYEHNPYNPLTRHVVNSCPFDDNAHLISARTMRRTVLAAGFSRLSSHYRVFFPLALARLRVLEQAMTWLPIGAQYYVSAIK